MSGTHHRSIANVGTTAAAAVLRACEGLITVAYLLKVLGAETFGIWALISTTTVYFLILDLGVVGSLGRLVAGCRGQDDIDGLNRTVSTALTLLAAVGTVTLLAAFGMAEVFPLVFHVPGTQLDDVRMALLIVGFGIAFYFPTSIFNVVLWSYERFDLINLIEMPVIVVRVCLTLWLIHETSSLTLLAGIGLAMNIATVVLSAALAWWVEPRLRLLPGYLSRAVIRDIYSVGVWFSALSIARALTQQIGPTLVGYGLGNRAVATFTIARQLTTYVATVMLSLTQIAAPRAAVLFFGRHGDEQKSLFVGGGRAAMVLALFFVGGFLCLGSPFISIWQGGRQNEAFVPLAILLLGELFPMGQGVTYSILTAMGRHRQLAVFAFLEGIASLGLAATTIKPFGVVGVCVAIAVSSFLFRGFGPWILACRLLDVSAPLYLRKAVLPVVAVWAIVVVGVFMIASANPPTGWISLIGYGMLYAALYLPACVFVIFGSDALTSIRELILRRSRIT